jgi:hypothetical protein
MFYGGAGASARFRLQGCEIPRSTSKPFWGDEEFPRGLVRTTLREVREAEMTERREGRADGGPEGLPVGVLRPDIDHAGRPAGAADTAGSKRGVLD